MQHQTQDKYILISCSPLFLEAVNDLNVGVATVMTDVFQKNGINLLRKFSKIVIIFDKVDDSKTRGVI